MNHIAVANPEAHFIELNRATMSGRNAAMSFTLRNDLPVGSYSGSLLFNVCTDLLCTSTYSGSPFRLEYDITVHFPPPPTVVPAQLDVPVEANTWGKVPVVVHLVRGDISIALRDPQGRFYQRFDSVPGQTTERSIGLNVLPISTVGTYTGTLTLLSCPPFQCDEARQMPGASREIPYTISVTPEIALEPIAADSGLPEWETYQGNSGHTGYVPLTLDAGNFTSRWTWDLPLGTSGYLTRVATGLGNVVVTSSELGGGGSLFAINESTGVLTWRRDFSRESTVSAPSVWGGRVFVVTLRSPPTMVRSYDLQTGSVSFETEIRTSSFTHLAPVVAHGSVYTSDASYGVYALKGISGEIRWATSEPPVAPFGSVQGGDASTPAVDSKYVYASDGRWLSVLDRLTGLTVMRLENTLLDRTPSSLNVAPVLPGDGSVLLLDAIEQSSNGNHLIRYDIAGQKKSWHIQGRFWSNPVVAGNTVYVTSGENQLEARGLDTGALLWTWQSANPNERIDFGTVVVTDNLIFFCAGSSTYAVDLQTREVVWSTPQRGELAISSAKILYIQTATKIHAFDLS
jgi:outer membrane protein assembly factor BamB